jgi:hypothetical protein
MLVHLCLCLATIFLVSSPLIGRKAFDYINRKRFERMVDRVGAAL